MKMTKEEMQVLKRSIYVSELESEKVGDSNKRLSKALHDECSDIGTIVLFISIGAGVVILALAGIV
jgi:hypothetical protein